MKKINYLFAFLISFVLIACQANESASQEKSASTEQSQATVAVSLNEADWIASMKAKPGVILDVRTESEFLYGHIEGGQLIDITSSDFTNNLDNLSLDKSQAVYVYCRSGNRSKKAMSILKDQGFTEIYELDKGVLGWERSGYKLVK